MIYWNNGWKQPIGLVKNKILRKLEYKYKLRFERDPCSTLWSRNGRTLNFEIRMFLLKKGPLYGRRDLFLISWKNVVHGAIFSGKLSILHKPLKIYMYMYLRIRNLLEHDIIKIYGWWNSFENCQISRKTFKNWLLLRQWKSFVSKNIGY